MLTSTAKGKISLNGLCNYKVAWHPQNFLGLMRVCNQFLVLFLSTSFACSASTFLFYLKLNYIVLNNFTKLFIFKWNILYEGCTLRISAWKSPKCESQRIGAWEVLSVVTEVWTKNAQLLTSVSFNLLLVSSVALLAHCKAHWPYSTTNTLEFYLVGDHFLYK